MKNFITKNILFLFSLLLLTSCATSHVLVGAKRPPIPVSQVKIYSKPPRKFEEIAMMDTSSKGSWAITEQGKMDTVIERLKEEAASLGANGVLLQGIGNQSGGAVMTGFGSATAYGNSAYGYNTGIAVPVNHKAGNGIAIYVIAE